MAVSMKLGEAMYKASQEAGEDVSGDCAELQSVATALWTQEVIDAYAAHIASQALPESSESE